MQNILLVDSVSSYRGQVAWHLAQMGYSVFEAADGDQAFGLLEEHSIDVVVVDKREFIQCPFIPQVVW